MATLSQESRPPAAPMRAPRTFFISRWLYLRALGLAYVVAFLSLGSQLEGLLGDKGLLPAAEFLRFLDAHGNPTAFLSVPSLLWLRPDAAFLHVLSGAGLGASTLLLFGLAPRMASLLAWITYLSITAVGRDFFAYQWDSLLLEAGLLAVFLAPGGLRPRVYGGAPSAWSFVWLSRFVLVKLMVGSAVVKMTSGDPAWPGLTALNFYFETQALPTFAAWWAHALPPGLLQSATAAVLVIELASPLLIFGPGRVPALAAVGFVAWFTLLSLSGNHAFMNLLAAALCLLLIEDRYWLKLRSRRSDMDHAAIAMARARPAWRVALHGLIGATLALASCFAALDKLVPASWMSGPPRALVSAVAPLRSFNSYGMFPRLTRARHELVIEGSLDGSRWIPYEFRWKPGRQDRAPGFIAPFHPRLDWQMGFEADRMGPTSPWFDRLLKQLLRGDRAILGLLDENPFPLWPPRFVRAVLYEYRFTTPAERQDTGQWWHRRFIGERVPPQSLSPEEQFNRLPDGVIRS